MRALASPIKGARSQTSDQEQRIAQCKIPRQERLPGQRNLSWM